MSYSVVAKPSYDRHFGNYIFCNVSTYFIVSNKRVPNTPAMITIQLYITNDILDYQSRV